VSDKPTQDPVAASAGVPTSNFAEFIARHNRTYQTIIWTVVVVSVLGGTIAWLGGWLDIQDVGYWGAFLVNLVGSAAVVVPVPGLAAVCAAVAPDLGLNFVILALAGAAGSTIGELTGYLAGFGSQGMMQKSRYYSSIRGWVVRRGGLTLFILAVIPNPLFDIGGIAAGSLGYPISRFFLWVGLGKLIKFLIVGYACRQSISWLSDLV
jgi:membrane protein YqaA with SNARE-associated domain